MVSVVCHVRPGTEEIVSALLMDAGFDGIEEQGDALTAYMSGDQLSLDISRSLQAISTDFQFTYDIQHLADTNWNERWESQFQPVEVGQWCRVRATFHKSDPTFEMEVVIDPKMSFGTGHHATTYLIMARMKHLSMKGKTVLDMGCGSGILAILAERMGAGYVDAIDNDPWAFANTEENLNLNDSQNVQARLGEFEVIPTTTYDIVLANINRHILMEGMTAFNDHLKPSGQLLLSGILNEDGPVIEEAFVKNGFRLIQSDEKDGWLCMLAVKDEN